VLLVNGDGTFQVPISFGVPSRGAGMVLVGDFNGDGTPDLAQLPSIGTNPPFTQANEVEVLLNQDLPPAALVAAAATLDSTGTLAEYQVRGFDATGRQLFGFDPYVASEKNLTLNDIIGVRIARADFTGDRVPDIFTAPGSSLPFIPLPPNPSPSRPPLPSPPVRIFDVRTGWSIPGPLGSVVPYPAGWTGGMFVAAGDINGDGTADLVTGASGGPHVRVLDGRTLAEAVLDGTPGFAHGFYAFDPSFTSGVYVAAADMNGDGQADRTVGAGLGALEVKVFSGDNGSVLRDFQAYSSDITAGVSVAAADVNHDGTPDLIAAPGGGTQVNVYSGLSPDLLESFAAFPASPYGAVFVGG
jgi:hypothetical protein